MAESEFRVSSVGVCFIPTTGNEAARATGDAFMSPVLSVVVYLYLHIPKVWLNPIAVSSEGSCVSYIYERTRQHLKRRLCAVRPCYGYGRRRHVVCVVCCRIPVSIRASLSVAGSECGVPLSAFAS